MTFALYQCYRATYRASVLRDAEGGRTIKPTTLAHLLLHRGRGVS